MSNEANRYDQMGGLGEQIKQMGEMRGLDDAVKRMSQMRARRA